VLYSYAHDTWVYPFLHHPNDVVVDPARVTLLPAAAVLFREAVQPAKKHVVLKVKEEDLYTDLFIPGEMMAYRTGLWQKMLSLSWNKKDTGISPSTNLLPSQAKRIQSSEGQLLWDWHEGYRLIDTPSAQAFVGMASGRKRNTSDVVFKINNEFLAGAVISAGKNALPISKAEKLFVFITSKADNHHSLAGIELDDTLKYSGGARIMSEAVSGSILIKNSNKALGYRIVLPSGETGKAGNLTKTGEYWKLPLNLDDRAYMYEVKAL
jgi:hypothetical protein